MILIRAFFPLKPCHTITTSRVLLPKKGMSLLPFSCEGAF